MKVCVFGAGALGGHVATRMLATQAADVSIVARGALLDVIRSRGFVVRSSGKEIRAKPKVATDDPSSLPKQDLVIVVLKSTALAAAAEAIKGLLAPQGCALFLINGIPWWWRHGLPGAGGPLPVVDPDGVMWSRLTPQKALGCVVYSPNEAEAPGVINHIGINRFVIGEPDGTSSARLSAAVDLFSRAGLNGEASADIRREVWRKLVSNASANPLCALTRYNVSELGADPGTRGVVASMMREVLAVAAAQGCDLRAEVDVEKLSMGGRRKPDVRPSMLQDVLARRPLEIEAQLGQLQAFARATGIAVPTIDIVLALTRGLDLALRAA